MNAGSPDSVSRRRVLRTEDLPVAATPYPGESIYSWLDATRKMLRLGVSEWSQWCAFSDEEPERRVGGQDWGALPPELDRIEGIPASWRIRADWRAMACSECFVRTAGGRRYPVLVSWLDARAIACVQHRLLLTYQPATEATPVDANGEILALWEWLERWRAGHLAGRDAKLCRDLVLASGRNWGIGFGGIASMHLVWSIEGAGWRMPEPQRRYQPLGPGGVGDLGPADRASALLGAYRAWKALNDPVASPLPSWPPQAWEWLARRWRSGCDERLGAMLAGIAAASRVGRR